MCAHKRSGDIIHRAERTNGRVPSGQMSFLCSSDARLLSCSVLLHRPPGSFTAIPGPKLAQAAHPWRGPLHAPARPSWHLLAAMPSSLEVAGGARAHEGPRAAPPADDPLPATNTSHGRCAAVVIEGTAARHLKAAKFAGRLVAPAVQPSTACAARRAATT